MRSLTRPMALLAACGLALLCSACSSNNKGKIEGKWKLVEAPGLDKDQIKFIEAFGAALVFDFKPDGTVTVGLETNNPLFREGMAKSSEPTSATGKYKLLRGDRVEFSGMSGDKKSGGLFGKSDKSILEIKINGDEMTMTGTDGTGKLVRYKEEAVPAGKTDDKNN